LHGLSREVFPDLNGNTKSARLVVTCVGWHTTTYTGVGRNGGTLNQTIINENSISFLFNYTPD